MQNAKILLIDRDRSNCQELRAVLEPAGYQIRQEYDGITALVEIDRDRPDLIISGMDLPRLGGLKLVRAIKDHDETKAVPVIFLTKHSDAKSMIEGINAGAKYYVTKPFENDELLSKVKKAL